MMSETKTNGIQYSKTGNKHPAQAMSCRHFGFWLQVSEFVQVYPRAGICNRLCRLLSLVLVAFAALPGIAAEAENRTPDILLIVVESLRADHVTAYGYHRATTPALDRLASQGVRFTRAFATSGWTMPSIMSLFTGVLPHIHGTVDYQCRLDPAVSTLAEALKRVNYQTIGITANPTTHGRFGFSKGFEYYDDMSIIQGIDPGTVLGGQGFDIPFRERTTGDQVTRFVLDNLVERDPDFPLFLHAFYFDPHYDYCPPDAYRSLFTDPAYSGTQDGRGITRLRSHHLNDADIRHIIALYDAEIRYTDDQIASVIATIDESDAFQNTIVIVVGDHGEEFWERGRPGHGHSLFDELVHVPLIIRWPARIPAGLTIDCPVSLVDIKPMLMEFLQLPVPEQCVGRNPLRYVTEHSCPLQERQKGQERLVYMSTQIMDPALVAIRTQDRKVIRRLDGRQTWLFDLVEDPDERTNLFASPRASEFKNLIVHLDRFFEAVRGQAEPSAETALDPQLQRALRSLGYIQ